MNWKGLVRLLKLVLVLGVVLGSAYLAVFKTDWFIIKALEVQANADQSAALDENYKKYYDSRNIFLVSLEEGADALRSDPAVRSAEIRRKLPATLIYRIDYRIPLAAVQFEDLFLLVDKESYLVNTTREIPQDVPQIIGLKMDGFVTGKLVSTSQKEQLKVVLDLVSLLGKASLNADSQLLMEEQTVLVTLKSGISGRFWYRGAIEDSFNRFMTVYNDQLKKGVTSGLIDVSSEGYPVYKPFGE